MKKQPWHDAPTDFAEAVIKDAYRKPRAKKARAKKVPSKIVGSGRLVRRLQALEKRWLKEAAGFHRMGRDMAREGNMTGKEYMQTAACWRSCAKELKQVMTSNIRRSDTP